MKMILDQVESPTVERMISCVLTVYGEQVGPVSALAKSLNIDWSNAPLSENLCRTNPHDLQRIYSHALPQLAVNACVREGRAVPRTVDWHVILYCLDSGRTLREAIQRACDCLEALDGRYGLMKLSVRSDRAELHFDTLRAERDAVNCLIDLNGIPQIFSQMSWIIDDCIPITSLFLNYPIEVYKSLNLPKFPFPIEMRQESSGLTFPSVFLDYPLVRRIADKEESNSLLTLFFLGGASTGRKLSAAERVRIISLRTLRDEERLPAFHEIVAQSDCSSATLRRRLAEEGISFRMIRDSCRREVAFDLLKRTDLPIEEIARRLNFCDSNAFRQAFRGWTGGSPTRYRQSSEI